MNETFKYVNFDYLNKWVNGDEEFIKTLIQLFIDLSPDVLLNLEKETQNKNWDAVGDLAHNFASQLIYVGMNETSEKARKIEEFSSIPDKVHEIPEILQQVITETRLALEELKLVRGLGG